MSCVPEPADTTVCGRPTESNDFKTHCPWPTPSRSSVTQFVRNWDRWIRPAAWSTAAFLGVCAGVRGTLGMPVPKGKFAAAGWPSCTIACASARTGSFAVETIPKIVMSVTGSRPGQAVGETLFPTTQNCCKARCRRDRSREESSRSETSSGRFRAATASAPTVR
jgi:hypothetical protein